MKMNYERPLMKAELFTTSSYCGSCANKPQVSTGLLHVDPAMGSEYWTSLDHEVSYDNSAFANFDMTHTFPKNSLKTFQWSGTNYYYTCNCEGHNGKYFLEYSTYQTNQNGGNPVFFLYYDSNNNGVINPSNGSNWPLRSGNNDTAIARVTFKEGFQPVVNS